MAGTCASFAQPADRLPAGVWEIAFLANEPARAAVIDFTAPYVLIEGTYMVAADSPLQTVGNVDRAGVRIAVARGSAYDLYLTRRGARRAAIPMLVGAGALLGWAGAASVGAGAQGARGILIDGNAVVPGFWGTQPPLPFPPSANDQATIDLNGPSARVMDLQAPGAPPQAQLLTAPKPFTVVAAKVGQVFAVALDNATPPNIYLGATSSYGLPIVVPGANGATVRAKAGGPNASFMPGLFGPAALGGGPGSIWRVDGVTGEVRLFA